MVRIDVTDWQPTESWGGMIVNITAPGVGKKRLSRIFNWIFPVGTPPTMQDSTDFEEWSYPSDYDEVITRWIERELKVVGHVPWHRRLEHSLEAYVTRRGSRVC